MSSQVVRYAVDDETVARFEIELESDWEDVTTEQVLGKVREAVTPAVNAARVVLHKVREMSPDDVEVKFAIKASGTANWLIAKAATEGNFEVTLTWKKGSTD